MTFGDTAPGKLVNLLSNDVNRFELVSMCVNSLWTSPLMAIIGICFNEFNRHFMSFYIDES